MLGRFAVPLALLVARCRLSRGKDFPRFARCNDALIVRRLGDGTPPTVARGSAYVIDGDTIAVNGVRVRLADIDAPEMARPACGRELALGLKAKRRLRELIEVGPFEIADSSGVDQYGRQLRIVRRNGRSLGDVLVSGGLARRRGSPRLDWCR